MQSTPEDLSASHRLWKLEFSVEALGRKLLLCLLMLLVACIAAYYHLAQQLEAQRAAFHDQLEQIKTQVARAAAERPLSVEVKPMLNVTMLKPVEGPASASQQSTLSTVATEVQEEVQQSPAIRSLDLHRARGEYEAAYRRYVAAYRDQSSATVLSRASSIASQSNTKFQVPLSSGLTPIHAGPIKSILLVQELFQKQSQLPSPLSLVGLFGLAGAFELMRPVSALTSDAQVLEATGIMTYDGYRTLLEHVQRLAREQEYPKIGSRPTGFIQGQN